MCQPHVHSAAEMKSCGVIGAETDEVKPLPVPVSVIEGESVILEINLTEIHTYWMILWRFDGDLISQITEGNITYKDGPDGIFKDRLQLDSKTAFLNITNMRKKHSGLYELEAISKDASGSPKKEFSVDVKDSPSVNLGGRIEMKTQSVNKGQPVTLETDIPHLHDELIVWRFGDEGKLIAKHYAEAKNSTIFDNSADGKFRNRLNLNNQNGSLTITNTNTSDSGHYIVMISSNKQTLHKRFIVTVSGE
ncbi:uncharacterized protein LOC125254281 [Megalobrama amblycephala]|uniref:uncharacterized protein LOC125254281 n=1 Tax=Megalobrama amblycephala TaxID=75352 RepID=UPI0020146583|nr:uncharacterized protein LOC125254281 [Megalobrama amblycephala]